MRAGDRLAFGDLFTNGPYRLALQSDGNLVLLNKSQAIWTASTPGHPGSVLQLQGDGNLVLRDSRGKVTWASATRGGVALELQADGNLVLRNAQGGVLWASNTKGGQRAPRKRGSNMLTGIVDAVTSVPGTVSSAVTGKKGVLGSKGVLGNLTHLRVANAVKAAGGAVSKVGSNHLLQATMGNIAVPASLIGAVVKGGPKAGLSAVKHAANNPIIKAELAAAAVIFPPVAPISAAGIAGMEGASRIVDGIRSKNPALVAQAVMQVAGTQLLAQTGNAGAARALGAMKTVSRARDIVNGVAPQARRQLAAIQGAAKQGNAGAKNVLAVIKHQALREAHKTIESKTAPPKVKAGARRLITSAQKKAPGLLAGTVAAIRAPRGVRAGDFQILRSGRVLYRGEPVRKAV